MDLTLNDEQEIIKSSARKFLEKNADKSVIRELEASETGFSKEIWKKMAELGWMGAVIPEEYGGVAFSLIELAIIFEEIGRAAMPCPMLSTLMGTLAIMEAGTDTQKKELLPKIAGGEIVLAMAIEEPGVNYSIQNISMTAVPDNNGYVLNGTKLFVSYATVADYLLVAARTSGNTGDEKGLALFVVDGKSDGIRFSPMKTMADKQFEVIFDNVGVISENIIGKAGGGLSLIENIYKTAAALQCAEMVGGAQQELEMTSEYTKIRHQFDRPIGTFQAVQHRLADMYIDVQGAKLATYKAIWSLSEGMTADQEVSTAKYFTNKACQQVAFSAQQLHGGIGFSLEYDLHFYYRRAKMFELKFGPRHFHLKKMGAVL